MAITDDLRKTLTDPTPLYFVAGTADIAAQQAKKVPALIEKIQTEAPERIEAVRRTDPKAVQEKAAARVKEVQSAVTTRANEFLGALDGDLKKLGENAQDLALRGVGVLAEYAVKAREGYDTVAEHGQEVVKQWRGEAAEEIFEISEAVEPKAEPAKDSASDDSAKADAGYGAASDGGADKPAAKKATARKAPAKKPAAKAAE
ncbi:hypothetical protein [Streptomyces sp. NBC_01431]|uniref:hypothetical protein n=1 Tax=Streptomyces sp. NBC_01431 TaxID=2903863 RepID=UPI002E2ED022|nr:hypothetical protein [Streptomyces sp. NBC_01431]